MSYGILSFGEDAFGVDDSDIVPAEDVFIGPPPLWSIPKKTDPGKRILSACSGRISIADLLAQLNRPFDKDPHEELIFRLRIDAGLSWSVDNGILTVNSP